MAFCDYSGIAYKIDVLASHARVVLPTHRCIISIHFYFILVTESFPGIYRESLPEAPALRRDASQLDRLVVEFRWVIADGNGNEPKPFKAEWAVIKARSQCEKCLF